MGPTGQLQDEREPHAARENTVNLESATWVPLRWPAEWRDASLLEPVGGAGVNCLLFDQSADMAAVRARAAELGFHVLDSAQLPPDVHVVRGEWPGIRISRQGAEAVAGPTGDVIAAAGDEITVLRAELDPWRIGDQRSRWPYLEDVKKLNESESSCLDIREAAPELEGV